MPVTARPRRATIGPHINSVLWPVHGTEAVQLFNARVLLQGPSISGGRRARAAIFEGPASSSARLDGRLAALEMGPEHRIHLGRAMNRHAVRRAHEFVIDGAWDPGR